MPPEENRFEALGSTCHLLGVGLGRDRLEEGAAWVLEMHRRFSRFLPDSELSLFHGQAGRQVDVSAELEGLLRAAVGAWWSSGGLVNACVLEAMLAIGYTRPLREGPTLPGRVATHAALPPLPEVLQVSSGRALLHPGAGIDLGGVAVRHSILHYICEHTFQGARVGHQNPVATLPNRQVRPMKT